MFSSIQGLLELNSDAAGDKNYADIDSVDEVDSDDGRGISSAPTMDRHSIADATIWHCSIIATIFFLHYRTMCHIATFPIYMAFSDLAWYGTIGTVYHWYTQTYYHDTQCEYKSVLVR